MDLLFFSLVIVVFKYIFNYDNDNLLIIINKEFVFKIK